MANEMIAATTLDKNNRQDKQDGHRNVGK